eukprot:486728_1
MMDHITCSIQAPECEQFFQLNCFFSKHKISTILTYYLKMNPNNTLPLTQEELLLIYPDIIDNPSPLNEDEKQYLSQLCENNESKQLKIMNTIEESICIIQTNEDIQSIESHRSNKEWDTEDLIGIDQNKNDYELLEISLFEINNKLQQIKLFLLNMAPSLHSLQQTVQNASQTEYIQPIKERYDLTYKVYEEYYTKYISYLEQQRQTHYELKTIAETKRVQQEQQEICQLKQQLEKQNKKKFVDNLSEIVAFT